MATWVTRGAAVVLGYAGTGHLDEQPIAELLVELITGEKAPVSVRPGAGKPTHMGPRIERIVDEIVEVARRAVDSAARIVPAGLSEDGLEVLICGWRWSEPNTSSPYRSSSCLLKGSERSAFAEGRPSSHVRRRAACAR